MSTNVTRSKEYKQQIMDLIYKDKISAVIISERFSIPESTVYCWCKQYETYGEEAFVGSGKQRTADAELSKLKRENEKLKMQVEILKKVAAYQAKIDAEKKSTLYK